MAVAEFATAIKHKVIKMFCFLVVKNILKEELKYDNTIVANFAITVCLKNEHTEKVKVSKEEILNLFE